MLVTDTDTLALFSAIIPHLNNRTQKIMSDSFSPSADGT